MDRPGATLVTLMHVGKNQLVITADWIQECVKHYEEVDDVFQKQFLQAIIFSGGRSESPISGSQCASSRLPRATASLLITDAWNQHCPGPYILLDGICTNFSDFIVTKIMPFSHPQDELLSIDSKLSIEAMDRKFQDFDDSGDNHSQIEIAVPSRLRSDASTGFQCRGYGSL